jgi:hypothetical protein
MNSLYDVANYDDLQGMADQDKAELAAQQRALYVKELFGRYYQDPTQKAVNPDEALALQVALWEVVQESEPAQGPPKFDLFAGDFQADYPPADAPAYVTLAQSYLSSLTGDDAAFYENADLRGRELVRLQGIPAVTTAGGFGGLLAAAGSVAQSQFALRYAGGGAPAGGGLASALTGTGGGLAGLGGPGGLGGGLLGGPGGGGAGALLGGGGGGGGAPGTGITTPPGSGITTPPVNTPPVVTPPVNGPETPGTPVPAPAGLLLGGIALGTFGAWRLGTRVLARK